MLSDEKLRANTHASDGLGQVRTRTASKMQVRDFARENRHAKGSPWSHSWPSKARDWRRQPRQIL